MGSMMSREAKAPNWRTLSFEEYLLIAPRECWAYVRAAGSRLEAARELASRTYSALQMADAKVKATEIRAGTAEAKRDELAEDLKIAKACLKEARKLLRPYVGKNPPRARLDAKALNKALNWSVAKKKAAGADVDDCGDDAESVIDSIAEEMAGSDEVSYTLEGSDHPDIL